MNIKTGDYKIITSGTVISFNLEPLFFDLAPDFKVRLKFLFEGDRTKNSLRFEVENLVLNILLINFNNSLGIGNTPVLPLGSIDGKEILLNFVVYSLSEESPKTVHYTFYEKGGADGI